MIFHFVDNKISQIFADLRVYLLADFRPRAREATVAAVFAGKLSAPSWKHQLIAEREYFSLFIILFFLPGRRSRSLSRRILKPINKFATEEYQHCTGKESLLIIVKKQ